LLAPAVDYYLVVVVVGHDIVMGRMVNVMAGELFKTDDAFHSSSYK